jgi:exonuclease III
MDLKTLTWNIGGGKLLQDGADLLRISSHAEDGLDAIVGLLKSEEPDVISLQETQRKEGYDQVELIAGSLGYEHYFHDSTSESHIDTDCRLGHCVISRYPIAQHRFGLFENPNAQVDLGRRQDCHDPRQGIQQLRGNDRRQAGRGDHAVPHPVPDV